MLQTDRSDEQAGATTPEVYLPAGANPSSLTSRLEWIWTTLFNHDIETPK